jgi:hypothetical protein
MKELARRKTGVKVTIYAYSSVDGTNQWGFVFPPDFPDPGGIPYSDPADAIALVAEALEHAHRKAAKLRQQKEAA